MNIEEIVAEFETCGHHPETARGECANESFRFVLALGEVGIDAEQISGFRFADEDRTVILSGHAAVRVGDVVYDWTARQFWPHDQPVPLVVPYDEWAAEWKPLRETIH